MNFLRSASVALGLLAPLPATAADPPSPAPSTEPAAAPAPEPGHVEPTHVERGHAESEQAKARAQKETVAELKKQLEFLAILWTEVERTLTLALKEEAEADQLEQTIVDLDDRSKRALLLIEQTEARRARAEARLRELGNKSGAPAPGVAP
jgi:hypothetical protein